MANKQYTPKEWEAINKKNSIGPALGMAMGKAIDLTIAFKDIYVGHSKKPVKDIKEDVLEWRNWIYEENNKKHQELLEDLPREGERDTKDEIAQEEYEF